MVDNEEYVEFEENTNVKETNGDNVKGG